MIYSELHTDFAHGKLILAISHRIIPQISAKRDHFWVKPGRIEHWLIWYKALYSTWYSLVANQFFETVWKKSKMPIVAVQPENGVNVNSTYGFLAAAVSRFYGIYSIIPFIRSIWIRVPLHSDINADVRAVNWKWKRERFRPLAIFKKFKYFPHWNANHESFAFRCFCHRSKYKLQAQLNRKCTNAID